MKRWMLGVLIVTAGMVPTVGLSHGLECLPGQTTEQCLWKAIAEINRLSADLEALRSTTSASISQALQEAVAARAMADAASSKALQCENRLNTLWINGSMCVLSNGACPAGFTRYSGHMRATRIYVNHSQPETYLTPVQFGDSRISWHGYPYQYGEYAGDIFLSACCK
ncbi:hypothetical protein [Archangium sp.]|uniref:hypothetical protein n=1 Tax=Archangium sp. TaxID=1872627 RepID=UPI002D675ED5|nr:hypothetical protein [Archangium sp.]HYO58434.1 hypothetical protein [Archangium sp.]